MVSPISISITAVDKTTQVFQKLNSRIEKMQAPIVNLQRSFARFTQVSGLSRLSEGFGRVQGSALGAFRVMGQIAPVLGSITGAVTIAGISRLATSWANFGSNLQTSAQRLGMSTGRLQVWQNGARLAGVSAESLTSGMQSLQDTMWNAVGGRDPKAMATFQQLHINLQNMDGSLRNVSEVIPEVADKIASIRNPSAQAAVATNFFHGAGEALLPFLRDGSAGLARYQRMAMKYGVVNDDGAEAANRLRMSQTGLTLAVEGFGNSISRALEPVLTPVIDSMANWIARNREWISQDIGKYVRDFVNWLKSINWQGFSNGVTNAWGKIHDFANGVSNTVERMGGLKTVLEIVAGIMGFKIVGSILGIIGPFASLAMTVGRIVVPAMLSLVTAMGPVGWAIMAAGVIIGAASVYIYKHWDTFRPYWEKLWSAIRVATKFSMDTLYSLISPFIRLAGKIIDNWDPIKKFFSDMFVFLRKEFDSFVGKITWMANKVSAAANKIKNAVGFGGKKKTEINSSIDQVQPMGIEQMAAIPGANAEQALASADNLKKIASQPVAAANDNISSRKKGISFPSDNSIGNIVRQVTGGDPRDVAEAKALIMTESGGRMIGNSRTSAYGYTQLTDAAAKDMGVNKYDPYQNVQGGWKYFQKMLARTNGNMIAAYGAYHDGGNSIGVRKFINSGGVDFSGFSKEAKKAMKNFENYYNQARGGDLPFVNMPVQMPRMGSSINMGNLSSITPVTQDSGLGKLPGSGVTSMPSAPSMTMLPANAGNIQDNHLYLEIDIRGKTENMDIKPKSRSNTLTIQSVSYQRAMDPGRTAGGM
ncbi:transglycosylase SLT domain-containing protein [Commensalibacter sp. A3DC]|uniref:lytic transglycosylase domain-containing protein n=1 Tax=Commensalibacter sp. A3DC TaxID=3093920 RepID=UPI0039B5F776